MEENIIKKKEALNKVAWAIGIGLASVAIGFVGLIAYKKPANVISRYNKFPRLKKPRKYRRILKNRNKIINHTNHA